MRYHRLFALDSDKDVFEKMMREEIAKECGVFYITVGDIGILAKREKDKLISYSINLNPALIEVLNEIASIHPRGEGHQSIPDSNRPGTWDKRGLRSLSAEEVARLLSSDLFSVFHKAWRPEWFDGMDGDVLANIDKESMVSSIWKDETLGSAYAVKLVSLLHQLRCEGVYDASVNGNLAALSVDQVRDLLSSPIFRGLSVDLSKAVAVGGAQLSDWVDQPDGNQVRLKAMCADPRFLSLLRDVQSGRASLSPCQLPLRSLSVEEVKRLLVRVELLSFTRIWGTSWYEDLDGQRLHQVVNNEIAMEDRIKCNGLFRVDITLIRSFTSIINGYYASGVPVEFVKGTLQALSVDQVRDLLSSPIFRGLSVDLSKAVAVGGAQLSEWVDHPDRNQEELKAMCPDPHFLSRLRDVQSGRASLSPCRLPLLSLSKVEVIWLLEGDELKRFSRVFSRVWGRDWNKDVDGQRLHEAVNNEEVTKRMVKTLSRSKSPLDITLIRSFASVINNFYVNGVPEGTIQENEVDANRVGEAKTEVGEGVGESETDGGEGVGESKTDGGEGVGESKTDGGEGVGGSKMDGGEGVGENKTDGEEEVGESKTDGGEGVGENKTDGGEGVGERKTDGGEGVGESETDGGEGVGESKTDGGEGVGESKMDGGEGVGESKTDGGEGVGESKMDGGEGVGESKTDGGEGVDESKSVDQKGKVIPTSSRAVGESQEANSIPTRPLQDN
eukprot:gene3437-4265_t